MTVPAVDLPALLAERLKLPPEQVGALLDSGNPQQLLLLALAGREREQETASRSEAEDHGSPHVIRRLIVQQQRALLTADRMALYIAQALGACPQCWGLDQRCPACAGQGGPGSSQPDADRLLNLVRPALRRLGFEITPAAGYQPPN